MYLMRAIHDLEGRSYNMAGLFPIESKMEPGLRALGYREVTTLKDSVIGPKGICVRGHEFHYSRIMYSGHLPKTIYDVTDRKDEHKGSEGFLHERVLGSYIHLHWGSNPEVAKYFVQCCKTFG